MRVRLTRRWSPCSRVFDAQSVTSSVGRPSCQAGKITFVIGSRVLSALVMSGRTEEIYYFSPQNFCKEIFSLKKLYTTSQNQSAVKRGAWSLWCSRQESSKSQSRGCSTRLLRSTVRRSATTDHQTVDQWLRWLRSDMWTPPVSSSSHALQSTSCRPTWKLRGQRKISCWRWQTTAISACCMSRCHV